MHLGLTRLCGRAAPGERVVEATPGESGPHYTVVAALSLDGIKAPWVFEDAMTTVAFETYVKTQLAPTFDIGDEACNFLESKGWVVFRRNEFLVVTASDNMNHGTALTLTQAVDQRLK